MKCDVLPYGSSKWSCDPSGLTVNIRVLKPLTPGFDQRCRKTIRFPSGAIRR